MSYNLNGNLEDSADQMAVMLPCDQDKFSEFISGLLGKPQTIEKTFYGTFKISRQDIENIFHLVDQRISQQNEASLIQFNVRIMYHDNSSVLINSLEEFIAYTEVRPLRSIGVTLSWSYLMKFQQKDVPEKQQIDLTFRSGEDFNDGTVFEDGILIIRSHRYSNSGVHLRINHTERTWGVDIESLIGGHIKGLLASKKKISYLTYKHSEVIGLCVMLVLLGSSLYSLYVLDNNIQMVHKEQILNLKDLGTDQFEEISEKIDFLLRYNVDSLRSRFDSSKDIFLFVSFIISVFIGTFIGGMAGKRRPRSFVLLSKIAIEDMEKKLGKVKKDWLMFILSLIASVLAGVLSNYIYAQYIQTI